MDFIEKDQSIQSLGDDNRQEKQKCIPTPITRPPSCRNPFECLCDSERVRTQTIPYSNIDTNHTVVNGIFVSCKFLYEYFCMYIIGNVTRNMG